MKTYTSLDHVRNAVRSVIRIIARTIHKLSGGHVTPNHITYLSLLGHVPIAYLIATGEFLPAAGLLVVFGLMDTLDGELARLQNKKSNKGMFLDSVTDRVKEVMLYGGAGLYFIRAENPYAAIWTIAACGIAVTVSYLNAWGEVVTTDLPKSHDRNKTYRNGLMTYDVRIFVIIIGLLTTVLDAAIVTIAVLSVVTALQRFVNVYRRLA